MVSYILEMGGLERVRKFKMLWNLKEYLGFGKYLKKNRGDSYVYLSLDLEREINRGSLIL